MAKIMIECSNPNDLKELEAAMEQAAGKCNITHYKQHLGLVEAGKSTSQRDSARIIAAEAGESPSAVEQRIRRGKQKVRQPVAVPQNDPSNPPDPDDGEPYSEAMARAVSVITSLKCIKSTLPRQREALQVVLEWIEKRLKPKGDRTPKVESIPGGIRVSCWRCGVTCGCVDWKEAERMVEQHKKKEIEVKAFIKKAMREDQAGIERRP